MLVYNIIKIYIIIWITYKFVTKYSLSILDYLGRHRIIKDRIDDEPYLERYYLFIKDRKNFPFNIFLHKFLKSDPDDLHDHPWPYFTFILCGGYWEYTPEGKFWRGPLSFRWNKAKSFHRLELDNTKPTCWTLFIPGPKQREWGFKTKEGWVHNEKYLKTRKCSKKQYKQD